MKKTMLFIFMTFLLFVCGCGNNEVSDKEVKKVIPIIEIPTIETSEENDVVTSNEAEITEIPNEVTDELEPTEVPNEVTDELEPTEIPNEATDELEPAEVPDEVPDEVEPTATPIPATPTPYIKPNLAASERLTHEKESTPTYTTIEEKKNVENSVLPRIDINITSEEFALCKENYMDCTITFSNAEGYVDSIIEAPASVRLRGNSTACLPKHPLKIKFKEKVTMYESGPEKSWTLLANLYDKTGLHNAVAFDLYRQLNPDRFTSICEFVDVYINGKYQGVYNLCDQIETGKTRVNINGKIAEVPEDTEYLIVQDMRIYYDGSDATEGLDWFWMAKENVAFEVKSPDTSKENYSLEYTAYVKSTLDSIYYTILLQDYEKVKEVVDIESMIDGFMVGAISKNQDINKASVYYTIKDGVLAFGPLWDFDLTFGGGEIGNAEDEVEGIMRNVIFASLWKIPEFKEAYIARFNEIKDEAKLIMLEKIDDLYNSYASSLENDYLNWSKNYYYCNREMYNLSYEEQIDYMKEWIETRIAFLDSFYNEQ